MRSTLKMLVLFVCLLGFPVIAQAADDVLEPDITRTVSNRPASKRASKDVKAFSGIVGRVVDENTGEGLIEAGIKVISGRPKTVLTDIDGYFRIKLPPGTYDLRFFYELYQGHRVSGVVVKKGQTATLHIALKSDEHSVQEVVVEAKVDRRNESALLQERKKAVTVRDSISSQEIARTPDSNAGDAARRVVSVTLLNGRYVYIRGLGGRYASTLLNNTVMPNPEPDEPSVPLDLFPVALLSNLSVVKTYSPELPGQFGGGSLTVDTNTFPTKLEVRLRAKIGADTVTTFQNRLSAPLSLGENFGFRDGLRDLPAEIPRDKPLKVLDDQDSITPAEQQAAGRSLVNNWTPSTVLSAPNGTLGAQIGNTIVFGGKRRFGFLVAAQWSRREATRRNQGADVSGALAEDGNLLLKKENPTQSLISSVNASLSGLTNLGLKFDKNNEVNFLALALTNAQLETTQSEGRETISANQYQRSGRINFTQRLLSFNQLKGFHRLASLADSEIDWQANYAHVERLAPDIRDTRYLRDEVTKEYFLRVNNPNSAERFFLSLVENSGGGTFNYTVPWRHFRFKVGAVVQYRARLFDGRRLQFFRTSGSAQPGIAESLFEAENIGPGPGTRYAVFESTLNQDRYTATLGIYGGYGLIEWKPLAWLRSQIGLRYEGSRQAVVTGSPYVSGPSMDSIERSYDNPLPSVNVTFSPIKNFNVRAAYALTLARPSFRELAPFLFFDQVRRRQVSGNPLLLQTNIHHADLRAEWFPSRSEVIAVTLFGKLFNNPIERVVIGTSLTADFGFRNALAAQVAGVELEARASLGRIHSILRNIRLGSNASFIGSQIQIDPNANQLGRSDRPLQGQSPWVVNANVTWSKEQWGTEVGVFYNVYGPRITEVAALPLPDFYEQPFHKLDVTVTQQWKHGLRLKLSVANVLNQAVRIHQGDMQVLRYPPGVRFFASLTWAMP